MSAARTASAPRKPAAKRRLPSPAELAAGPLPPVVLLCGEEEFLLEEAFQLFWEHTTVPAMADFNRDLFQADEVKREELFAQAASFPMMAERRLVVLRRCEKAPAALLTDLATYLERPSPSTCLLLLAASVDKRRKVWQRVQELGDVYEFNPLSPDQLAAWLEDACTRAGCTLPAPQAQQLAEQLGPTPLRMAGQEVEKLCLLAGSGATISEADLATALGMEPDANPFKLLDAIYEGRTGAALAILQSLLHQPESAYTLVPLLGKSLGRTWFMRQLRDQKLGEGEIGERLGQKDWLVRRSLEQTRNWTLPRVEEALRLILEADLGLKGESALPPAQILFQLVVRLCRTQ
ncbi:MAG: DNA polymerase III subunit delta [Candidatus Delongbacteria bacterium]